MRQSRCLATEAVLTLLCGCRQANPDFVAPADAEVDAAIAAPVDVASPVRRDLGGAADVADPADAGSGSDVFPADARVADMAVADAPAAASLGHLKLTPVAVSAGDVALGATRLLSFAVTNVGVGPLTITMPGGLVGSAAFTAGTKLGAGTVLAPGASLAERVLFEPAGRGLVSARWDIGGDDGMGIQAVTFSGTGAPVGADLASWRINGVAHVSASGIDLTGVQTYAAGSAFMQTVVSTAKLEISFDAEIDMGTGGDGMTLTLADATRTTPQALGAAGRGLGYAGIPGVAVALVTLKGDMIAPSDNFVGVAAGPRSGPSDLVNWVTTNAVVPPLRMQKRAVCVSTIAGALKVWIDGVLVMGTNPPDLPAMAFVGFTAASGGSTDRHAVSNVSIVVGGADQPGP